MRLEPLVASPALQCGALCRFCGGALHGFLDLGMSPLCESFVAPHELNQVERFYPLTLFVCPSCWLVQLQQYVDPAQIFTEYAYYSSYSEAYLQHGRSYTEMILRRFGLGPSSRIIELASNDGYLLQHFVARGMLVLGIEPARNVAQAAEAKGVPTLVEFFGEELARQLATQGQQADLIIANNVLAQVPDLNSFVAGLKLLLKPFGVATIEFPHVMRLIDGNQCDTVYHEHFSYFSLLACGALFGKHGLDIFDVEEIWTHGGSLRLYLCHAGTRLVSPVVETLRQRERLGGLDRIGTYDIFARRVVEAKHNLVDFLINAKRRGKSIAAYGAPGKANTLLNYCGIRTDFIDYTVDRNPYKHGKYMPGTHIPIHPPERLAQTRPDYVLILPWNLKDEILTQLRYVRDWGGQFVLPIPNVGVVS